MTQIEALTKLQALRQAFFETKDVVELLNVTNSNANKIATRLAQAGLLIPIRRGRWALRDRVNKLAVPESLTSPYPAYVSLQSALYHHRMISQVPAITYAVSLARTRRYHTPLGTFSVHHAEPALFFGYELDPQGLVKIATPEKALADIFYFAPTKRKLFAALPELEFPAGFNWKTTFKIADSIKSPVRRKIAVQGLTALHHHSART